MSDPKEKLTDKDCLITLLETIRCQLVGAIATIDAQIERIERLAKKRGKK